MDGTPITAPQKQAILDGLPGLSAWGGRMDAFGPLAQRVTIINQAVGQALRLDQVFDGRLYQPVSQYLADPAPTVEGLVAALNGLPETGGSVVGGVDPVTQELRFDLVFDATTTTTATVNLGSGATTLGLSLPTPPAVEVDAAAHLHFSFNVGLANNNFSIRPDNANPTHFDLHVRAAGMGFDAAFTHPAATLRVVNGTLNLDASVAATFLDPHGDGTLTPDDLRNAPLANLVGLTTSGIAAGSFPLNAPLPGFVPLGATTIVASAGNVFSVPAPDVSLSVSLSSNLQTAISRVITKVHDVGFIGFFGRYHALPLAPDALLPNLNQSLNSVLYAAGWSRIEDFLNLTQAVSNYFHGGDSVTAGGLVSALAMRELDLVADSGTGNLARGPVSLVGGLDPVRGQLRFDVALDLRRNRTLSLGLNLGADAQMLDNLTLADDAVAVANDDLHLNLGFSFGLDLASYLANPPEDIPSQDIFLQVDRFTQTGSLHATGVNVGLTAGFLQAGTANGTVTLDPLLNVQFQNPDGNRKVTLSDLGGSDVNVLQRTHLTAQAPLSLNLPVQAQLGDYNFVGLLRPQILISSTDVFAETPRLQLHDFTHLLNFAPLSPQEVLTRLQQLGAWVAQFGQSPAFASQPIPFTLIDPVKGVYKSVGDVLDLGGAFVNDLSDQLVSGPDRTPTFGTAQGLAGELARVLGMTIQDVNAQYYPTPHELSFHVRFTHQFAPTNLPLNFSFQVTPLALAGGSMQLSATGAATFDFTFGFSLDPVAAPQLSGFISGVPPLNGQLDADAHFQVRVGNNPPVNVTVIRASTVNNQSLDDLAASVNAALQAAGLGPTVLAQVTSNALTLTPRGPAAGSTLTVRAALTDPAVTQFGFPADGRLTRDARFALRIDNGNPVNVTVPRNANNQSMDDLVSSFNDALQRAGVSSVRAARLGNRITLSLNQVSTGQVLRITIPAGDPMATELGFEDGGLARARVGDVFVERASVSTTVVLAGDAGQAPGTFKLLGIHADNVHAGGAVQLIQYLKNPHTGEVNGRIGLSDLFQYLTATGLNSLVLPVYSSVENAFPSLDLTGIRVDGDFLGPLGSDVALKLTVPNPGSPGAATRYYSPDFTPLLRFELLDYQRDVLGVLARAQNALSHYSAFRFLTNLLPGIGISVADLVNYAGQLGAVISGLRANPPANVQGLQQRLGQVLGLAPANNAVHVTLNGTALRIDLPFTTPLGSSQRALNLDMAALTALVNGGVPRELQGVDKMIQYNGLGQLQVEGRAVLNLALGIDLNSGTVPTPFIYDDTTATVEALVRGQNLNFKVAIGALGLNVHNGTILLDRDGRGTNRAVYAISLPATGEHKYYFADPDLPPLIPRILDNVRVVLTGQFNGTLPLYYPKDTDPMGGSDKTNRLIFSIADLSRYFANLPNSVVIAPSPDIATAMRKVGALLEQIRNPAVFQQGLGNMLGYVQNGLNSQAFVVSLPVVGSHFKDAAQFITGDSGFRDPLVAEVSGDVKGPDNELLDVVLERVRQGLSKLLGSAGLNLLVGQVTVTDASSDPRGRQFNMHLHQNLQVPVPLHFDIGTASLGLGVDGMVNLSVGWDFELHFGISLDDGFYFDTSMRNGLRVDFGVSVPTLNTTGRLGILQLHVDSINGLANSFAGYFSIDLHSPTGDRLPWSQIVNGQYPLSSIFSVRLNANADVNLRLKTDFGPGGVFPSIQADFHFTWAFSLTDPDLTGSRPVVSFNDVQLNLGSYFTNFVTGALGKVKSILDPIKSVLDVLRYRIPVLSDIAGTDVTLIGLAGIFGYGDYHSFLDAFDLLYSIATSVPPDASNITIHFGSFDLGQADPRRLPDLGGVQPHVTASRTIGDQIPVTIRQYSDRLNQSPSFRLEFPFLSEANHGSLFELLLGHNVDLFTFDMTELRLGFDYRQSFPFFWPISITLGGRLDARARLKFGYDTYGLQEFLVSHNPQDLLDGFYADANANYFNVTGKIAGGVAVGLEIFGFGAGAGVEGGIEIHVAGQLRNPAHADRIRYKYMRDAFDHNDLRRLFDMTATLTYGLWVWVRVDLLFIHIYHEFRIVSLTRDLFNGPGGSPEAAYTPIPATDRGDGVLQLNMGPHAAERLYGDTTDGDESFQVQHVSGTAGDETVDVTYQSSTGPVTQRYGHVRKIVAWGGHGNDTVDLRGVLADSELHGGLGHNTFYASDGTSFLEGGPTEDDLYGGAGPTTFHGGRGYHSLHAGTGPATVVETADTNFTLSDTQLVMENYGTDDLDGIHRAVLTGGPSPATFTVSGWTGTATLTGLGSMNTVVSTDDSDFTLSDTKLTRSDGADFTLTNIQRAVLTGGPGDNNFTVSDWSGSAYLDGGAGDDTYTITFRGRGEGSVSINPSDFSGTSTVAVYGQPPDGVEVLDTQVTLYDENVYYTGITTLVVNDQVIFDNSGGSPRRTHGGPAHGNVVDESAPPASMVVNGMDAHSGDLIARATLQPSHSRASGDDLTARRPTPIWTVLGTAPIISSRQAIHSATQSEPSAPGLAVGSRHRINWNHESTGATRMRLSPAWLIGASPRGMTVPASTLDWGSAVPRWRRQGTENGFAILSGLFPEPFQLITVAERPAEHHNDHAVDHVFAEAVEEDWDDTVLSGL